MGIIAKALAANTYTDGLNVELNTQTKDLDTLIGGIVTWVMVLAGIIAFFYLIYSGFIYLTAGGNADAAKKGQQGIINALIGLVIIFLAYAIVAAFTKFLSN